MKRRIILSLLVFAVVTSFAACKTMSPEEYEAMQAKAEKADKLAEQIKDLESAYALMEQELKAEIESQRIQIEKLSNREVRMTMQEDVIFPSGSITVNQQGRQMLSKIAKSLRMAPDSAIKIVGHTDLLPITDPNLKKRFVDNWELSAARAASVARVLIWGEEIEDSRIHVVGRAFVEPIADNRTEEGRQKNRRIEIFMIQ